MGRCPIGKTGRKGNDMADMREYKEIIKAAVAKERRADKNWSWRVVSINKSAAKIGWGYLDYLGEKDPFTVEIEDVDCNPAVVGTLPNGDKVYRFIGLYHWDDCKTIGEAISSAIHGMASSAHNIY